MALYDDVLTIGRTYLGPATERFISRQVTMNLKVSAEELAGQHLDELAKWCYRSGKLVMDEAKAQELGQKVEALKTKYP